MKYEISCVLIIALVTALTRFLPFLLFGGKRQVPGIITYLGKTLPYASIAMLVVFCLKDTDIISFPHGLPELIAGALTVVSYAIKRNTLLSILAGTLAYMMLVQFVFV